LLIDNYKNVDWNDVTNSQNGAYTVHGKPEGSKKSIGLIKHDS
jgi:hypothetical protein